jgi:hypothetical protein
MAKIEPSKARTDLFDKIEDIQRKMPGEIFPPQLWTGDVTPERLQMLLVQQCEKIALLTDEGGIFEVMGGLYSNGKINIDVFLQAHAGSSVRVERQERSAHLSSPALSIGLAVQPAVIASLSQGSKKKFRGNGALARFLYCIPENNIGKREVCCQASIPKDVKQKYISGIKGLLDLPRLKNSEGKVIPRLLVLDQYALDSWQAFALFIEERQGPQGEFEPIQDWTGKLPGASLRMAALFHVAEYGEKQRVINQATMERALDLSMLLIEHAQAAFGIIGNDKGTQDAKTTLKWIIENSLKEFTRRDCQRALKATFSSVDEVKTALEVLSDRVIISEPVEVKTAGRSSWMYKVNPAIHGQPIS